METKSAAVANGQKTILMQRNLDLPLDTVWKAWTEPEMCKKWWGPKDYTCPSCTIDLRVGGKCIASMKGPDGKEIWSTGTYKEIVPEKRLVYADNFSDSKGNTISASEAGMPGNWPKDLPVTVEFEEKDGKTVMKLRHEGIPAEMYDECIQGWEQCFDKLEKNVR